jgi:hypothetical protein
MAPMVMPTPRMRKRRTLPTKGEIRKRLPRMSRMQWSIKPRNWLDKRARMPRSQCILLTDTHMLHIGLWYVHPSLYCSLLIVSNENLISMSCSATPSWTRSLFSLLESPTYPSPELMGFHPSPENSHYNSKLLHNPTYILSSLTGGAILS